MTFKQDLKIVLIGNVNFTASMLTGLIEIGADIRGIVNGESSGINSDYHDLNPMAEKNNIPIFKTNNINAPDALTWISEKKPDVIFCFGWSALLKSSLLMLAPLGVVGFHPALLPQNRGRHPIIWALVLGLKKTGSTFFVMDEGADSGPIVSQRTIAIEELETASTLYEKVTQTALGQLPELLQNLQKKNFTPQDHASANYWRKRSKFDGKIDWRMSSQQIDQLVRALAPPYPGAYATFGDTEFNIWRVEKVPCISQNLEPGKIIEIKGKHILVKTGDAALWLIEHEMKTEIMVGQYL